MDAQQHKEILEKVRVMLANDPMSFAGFEEYWNKLVDIKKELPKYLEEAYKVLTDPGARASDRTKAFLVAYPLRGTFLYGENIEIMLRRLLDEIDRLERELEVITSQPD